jgi:hypothetical protein
MRLNSYSSMIVNLLYNTVLCMTHEHAPVFQEFWHAVALQLDVGRYCDTAWLCSCSHNYQLVLRLHVGVLSTPIVAERGDMQHSSLFDDTTAAALLSTVTLAFLHCSPVHTS